MQATSRADTPAEVELRRELHHRGLRFRKDYPVGGVTRSRPDIVFTRQKLAVFVDGCFWHSCPEHATSPKTNSEWWQAKLAANVERDRRHTAELEDAGWAVMRFWEHEPSEGAADAVVELLRERSSITH